jgi:hypothetical protein
MNIEVSDKLVREAAVINMIELDGSTDLQDRVSAELWCIREGINTMEHPELWDLTLGAWSTSTIVKYVLEFGTRTMHDQAAFLLCTIQELS